jgi:hypothetical protein
MLKLNLNKEPKCVTVSNTSSIVHLNCPKSAIEFINIFEKLKLLGETHAKSGEYMNLLCTFNPLSCCPSGYMTRIYYNNNNDCSFHEL